MSDSQYLQSITIAEHDALPGKVPVKKAGNYIWNGTNWERWNGSPSYMFYGSQSDVSYDYIGKQSTSGGWYILRINKSTGEATYAVGSSDMATAWADVASQDYDVWENHHV